MEAQSVASEHEKSDEMYIHFYTVIYPSTPDTLFTYWYKNNHVEFDVFEDIERIFQKMKEFKLCISYTGDIFPIKNERLLIEQFMLLGIQDKESCVIQLMNGTVKDVHCGFTPYISTFNDLFDVCFQNYDICQSFSSNDKEVSLLLFDKKDRSLVPSSEEEMNPYSDKNLMIVEFLNHRLLTNFIKLDTIFYTIFDSFIDNPTLNKWFITLIQKQEYQMAIQIIYNIEQFHNNHPSIKEKNEIKYSEDLVEARQEDEETKEIESTKRIRIFCDLFLEPNKDSDILLSEIYQEYCIASNWTNHSVLSMSNFIKTLRSLHKYPIKRRSKGMMIIGYHSLVSQQQRMLNEIINNQQERNILQYISPNDMKEIVYQYQEQIFSINQPYVRECFLLLYNTSTPLHAMTFSYFSSIPQLQPFLEKYAVYVERNISKPLRMNPSNDVELFRELSQECMLYFPFHIDLLKQKRKEESAVPKELDVDKNED